jgi:hypothetical protein
MTSKQTAVVHAQSGHQPTPIPISGRTRNLFILASVIVLVLILWAVPAVLVISLGALRLP